MPTATSKKPRASSLTPEPSSLPDADLDRRLNDVPPPAEAACEVEPEVPEFVAGPAEERVESGEGRVESGEGRVESIEIPKSPNPEIPSTLDPRPSSVSISVPAAALPMEQIAAGRYHLSSHVEVQRLSLPQRTALRRLLIGLDAAGQRLADGRRVAKNADVVRWLLEKAEAGFSEKT